jgi:hypothetical protein
LCPAITGNLTAAPDLNFSVAPQVSVAVLVGLRPATPSFQASTRSSAVTAAAGGAESVYVPMTETPVLPVLKP